MEKIYSLARNVHWMVLYQIRFFGADLKSNMAARVHNVFSLAEILKNLLVRNHKVNYKSSHGLWPGELKGKGTVSKANTSIPPTPSVFSKLLIKVY
jgi:hypothetical protein